MVLLKKVCSLTVHGCIDCEKMIYPKLCNRNAKRVRKKWTNIRECLLLRLIKPMKQTGITNMTITMSYKVCQFNVYMASCNLTVGSMDDTHIFAIAVWKV